MPLTRLILICLLLPVPSVLMAANPPVDPRAIPTSTQPSLYPPEDFAAYGAALYVKDAAVQRAAIYAITHYPQGFEALTAFLAKESFSENTVLAARLLTRYAKGADFELRITALYQRACPLPIADQDDEHCKPLLLHALLSHLYNANPKPWAAAMAESLPAHLQTSGRQISYEDPSFDQILQLTHQVDKTRLYPLVPLLIDDLEAFFTDVRGRAHQCLAAITGETYPFDPRADKNTETIEKYRQLYQSKLQKVAATLPKTPAALKP